MIINQSGYNLGSELFQAHNQMCILQLAIIWMFFLAITPVIAPDYSSNGLHYNLKEHATRDAILGQKIRHHQRPQSQKKPKPENTTISSASNSMGTKETKTQHSSQNLYHHDSWHGSAWKGTLLNEEEIFSGLTPEGRENLCSNCFETKLWPPSAFVSCLARTINTSPSVLMLSSCDKYGSVFLFVINVISEAL